jgi:hypothetical protein
MHQILTVIALLFTTPLQPGDAVDMTRIVADAEAAAVTNPYQLSIEDNYGDPDDFVKYIIRKPPAIA